MEGINVLYWITGIFIGMCIVAIIVDYIGRTAVHERLVKALKKNTNVSEEDAIQYAGVLQMRVYTNKRNSIYVLTVVGISMVFGIALFMQASNTIDREDDYRNLSDRLAEFYGYVQAFDSTSQRELEVFNRQRLDFLTTLKEVSSADAPLTYIHGNERYQTTRVGLIDTLLTRLMEQSALSRASRESRVDQIDEALDMIEHAAEDQQSHSYENKVLRIISLSLIRIGIIVILVYVCQIMLRIFRYYTKKADHYRALLDALRLSTIRDMTMEKALELVRSNVDIGPAPKAFTDKMMDTAAAIVSKQG